VEGGGSTISGIVYDGGTVSRTIKDNNVNEVEIATFLGGASLLLLMSEWSQLTAVHPHHTVP